MDNKPTTLTELCNKLIKEADDGKTVTSAGLKSLAQLTLNVIKRFQEQNSENLAFRIAAEHMLTNETLKKVEEHSKQILEADKADREKNGEA